jgi:hypothetical protein
MIVRLSMQVPMMCIKVRQVKRRADARSTPDGGALG